MLSSFTSQPTPKPSAVATAPDAACFHTRTPPMHARTCTVPPSPIPQTPALPPSRPPALPAYNHDSPAGGNLHEFVAETPCAVLDLLTPPYEPPERNCTYYRRHVPPMGWPVVGARRHVGPAAPVLGEEVELEVGGGGGGEWGVGWSGKRKANSWWKERSGAGVGPWVYGGRNGGLQCLQELFWVAQDTNVLEEYIPIVFYRENVAAAAAAAAAYGCNVLPNPPPQVFDPPDSFEVISGLYPGDPVT